MSKVSAAVEKASAERAVPIPIAKPLPKKLGLNGQNTLARRSNGNGTTNGRLLHRPVPVPAIRPPAQSAPIPGPRPAQAAQWKIVPGRFGVPDEHLVSLRAPNTFASEQFRRLRYAVEELKKTRGLSVFGVSSPTPGDGKTTTALNLAGSLAAGAQSKVLVVEADLRKPSIGLLLKMKSTTPGLAEFISQPNQVGLIQTYRRFNLAVLPAGKAASSPYEILKSARMVDFLRSAREHFDYIVVDLPPLTPFSDCHVIQEHVGGIIVVVRANRTPREIITRAIENLNRDKVLGIVFNDDRSLSRSLSRQYNKTYGGARNGNRILSRAAI